MEVRTNANFRIRRNDSELEIPVSLRGNPVLFGFQWTMHDAEPGSAIVTRVTEGSPAAAALLKPQHRILKINEKKTTTRDDFEKLLISADDSIIVDVELNGRFETLTIANQTPSTSEPAAAVDSQQTPRKRE